jgi:uncharacterized protein YutE (UPF0331/DUF86 family)
MDIIDEEFLDFISSCNEKRNTKVYDLNNLDNEEIITKIKYDSNGSIINYTILEIKS